MRHLITPMNLSVEETMNILDLAERISIGPQLYKHVADGRQLATLFYEPSTRTRLSFESAMLSLGGHWAFQVQLSLVLPKVKPLLTL